jgi:hypothetical protein
MHARFYPLHAKRLPHPLPTNLVADVTDECCAGEGVEGFRKKLGVEMNFHADTPSLLKQTKPQRDLSRFAER